MAIIFKNAPKTEEGKKLNLSKEDEEKYIIVYRINQESWQLEIVEPWDTEKEYDNMCVLMPLTSSYEDVVLLSSGTYVRNVVGSSGDTNPYGNCSWLGIIKLVYDVKGISEDADTCCLNGYAYNTTGTPPRIVSAGSFCLSSPIIIIKAFPSVRIKPAFYLAISNICCTFAPDNEP